ncbi:hypothetical protein D3C78_1685250 [compost metagenome]
MPLVEMVLPAGSAAFSTRTLKYLASVGTNVRATVTNTVRGLLGSKVTVPAAKLKRDLAFIAARPVAASETGVPSAALMSTSVTAVLENTNE